MLCLGRRKGQKVRINGEPLTVTDVSSNSVDISFLHFNRTVTKSKPFLLGALEVVLIYTDGVYAKLGFHAPKEVTIDREELWRRKNGGIIRGY